MYSLYCFPVKSLAILYLGFDQGKLLYVTLHITLNYENNLIFLQTFHNHQLNGCINHTIWTYNTLLKPALLFKICATIDNTVISIFVYDGFLYHLNSFLLH